MVVKIGTVCGMVSKSMTNASYFEKVSSLGTPPLVPLLLCALIPNSRESCVNVVVNSASRVTTSARISATAVINFLRVWHPSHKQGKPKRLFSQAVVIITLGRLTDRRRQQFTSVRG